MSKKCAVDDLKDCVDVLLNRRKLENKPEVSPKIFGRILKFKDQSHQETLHSSSSRSFVFVFGNDSIQSFMQRSLSIKEILLELGLTEKYIIQKIENDWTFELLIFEESERLRPIPATWEGIKMLLSHGDLFPKFVSDLYEKYYEDLKNTKYKDFENSEDYFRIWSNGKKNDSRYIDLERLEKMNEENEEITLSHFRLFLYLDLSCKELFDGKGFTIDAKTKKRGFREYFLKNINRERIQPQTAIFTPIILKKKVGIVL